MLNPKQEAFLMLPYFDKHTIEECDRRNNEKMPEDKDIRQISKDDLTPDMWKILPDQIRSELKKAVDTVDFDMSMSLANRIR